VDVNGTRFHLVLGRDDWFPQADTRPPGAEDTGPRAQWYDATATVGLTALPVTFPARRRERQPETADRRGAGRDRFGNWYWIGADGRSILARSPRDAAPVAFWPHAAAEPAAPTVDGDFAPADPPPPADPPRLQGLAVTGEHYLVAGNVDDGGLLVFDLAAGGPPVALRWPDAVPFEPWDVVATPDGGVWVMDRANERLWSLDRLLRVRERHPSPALVYDPDFLPAVPPPDDGLPDPVREGPVTLDASVSTGSVADAVAVEALCDGSALVMGRGAAGPTIHRFTVEDGKTWSFALADALIDHPQVRAELPRGHEMAFVSGAACSRDGMEGQLFVTTPDGNQSFAFTLSGPVEEMRVALDPRFYPMRRFGGRALVAAAGEAHYDSGDRWVSLLEYPRPHFAREAVLTLPVRAPLAAPAEPGTEPVRAFDGREPGCVWHRLFVDACIPPESSVVVESRAADALEELERTPWSAEPAPYLRGHGAELPFRAPDVPGPADQAGTWELLFQNAVGRFLQLRVTLRGNGRITPRIRALRAYFPRFSYLREYLPAAYREDAGSAWFLDRFLSNVEGTFTEVEERIAGVQLLFGAATVPAEFLEWLAGWMGAALDASWSEAKKRFFLSHAMEMFAGRGTRDGLIRALRLALEDCVDPDLFGTARKGAGDGFASSASADSLASAYAIGSAVPRLLPASASSRDVGCGCSGSLASASTARGSASSGSASSGSTDGSAASASPGSKLEAGGYGRFGVRVVEQFLTRGAAGVAFGDTGDLSGAGTTANALEWTPAQGADPLHRRWREWLAARYGDVAALKAAWGIASSGSVASPPAADALGVAGWGGSIGSAASIASPGAAGPAGAVGSGGSMGIGGSASADDFASFDDPRLALPSIAPANPAKAADWTRFLDEGLGFTWMVPDGRADLALWRDFLARRYRQPVDLDRAWGRAARDSIGSFDTLAYPAALPAQRTELADWITFVSVVVPMRRGAHRFTVLVPVAPGDDREAQRRRRELARRIALIEKPAHTVVETRLYWAAFRVGEARLGTDTLLGQGSRFTALVLDRGELAASHLGWTEPWNVRGRMVVGRDPVAASPHTGGTTQRWT
jgi:phage tail-like protein